MNKIPASIFNDVIGPVMIGPSSSHTAGPARIGMLVRNLIVEQTRNARFTFETNGSFAGTYKGQKSDQGLVAGLMGWSQDDKRLAKAIDSAKEKGIEVAFCIEDFSAPHPNTVRIQLESITGESASATGLSIGGGMVKIIEVNGFEVEILGDYWEHLIFLDSQESGLEQVVKQLYRDNQIDYEHMILKVEDHGALLIIKCREAMSSWLYEHLAELPRVKAIRVLAPVVPILSSKEVFVPFSNARELQEYCDQNNRTLWEAAIDYEASRGGITESEVLSQMNDIARTMSDSLQEGLGGNFIMRGFLTPCAEGMNRHRLSGHFVSTGILDKATCYAVAVMELNSAMGRVVASPTAGSCGSLPATIFSLAEELNLERLQIIRGLLCAGVIGVLIAEQATFAAEVCGCQAECGAAASMAAAAVVGMTNGSVKHALDSASLSLQNMLGLICDPVAEQVEIPCISRNVSAVSNAFTAANMVMGGFAATIPFDEVIQTMFSVGNQLPHELRCTGKGGLCLTSTAQSIKKQLYSDNN